MKVHHLNCGTMRTPGAPVICHVMAIETDNGLVLVDSGFGLQDCADPARIGPARRLLRPALDVEETAAHQVERLGFRRDDVRHIVTTHFDIDHIGGIADFPDAQIHVTAAELHYIDFDGKTFSVKGPSITPRPPQGQPIVAALGHGDAAYRLIAESADVGFVTPHGPSEATTIVDRIATHRPIGAVPVRVFADLVVFLADTPAAANARRTRLDDLAGGEFASDAEVFVGTPAQLADLLQQWHIAGVAGFRLRPATLPHDLHQITDGLVPELRRRGVFLSLIHI